VLEQLERKGQEKAPAASQETEELSHGSLWQKSVIGTNIFTSAMQNRNIRFEITCPEGSPQLVVTTRVNLPDAGSTSTVVNHVWTSDGTGANARGVILPNVLSELVKRAYR
jgi:hypothetical protein